MDFVTGICVPEIEMNLHSISIEPHTRPLRVTWTPELAQDLEAYHNIDAEEELTRMLTENLTAEIDNQILNEIMDLVPVTPPEPINHNYNILTPSEVSDINRQRQIREETVRKWDSLGFLEGLDGHLRGNITQLYENQARTLINETPNHGFDRIQFPTIRRVTPTLVANEIIDPQPLNAPPPFPEGRLFYFTPTLQEELEEYEVDWRTDSTWVYGNLYGSLIGITMELKPYEFIPKKYVSAFESVWLPNVNRTFS